MFNNKKYESRYNNATAKCDMCSCNNRSSSCFYETQSGNLFLYLRFKRQSNLISPDIIDHGICNGCTNNTGGDSCEICAANYYSVQKHPSLICSKCNCDLEGIFNQNEPCDRVIIVF